MNTYPTALNDAQQVVGYFGKRGGDYHPFITDSDGVGVREIRGPVPFHWWSGAPGINNAGQVVGTHSPGVAYITGPNGVGMRDLGGLGGELELRFWH